MFWEGVEEGQWSLCLTSCVSLVGFFSPVLKQQKLEEKREVWDFFVLLPENWFWWPQETSLPNN